MSSTPHPTPAGEVAYLAGLLRDLKQRTGLSLVELAARTPFSKSSWDRYLNGAALPPRPAVEALARLAGEPVPRLLALRERAEASWSGRAAGPPAPAPAPQPVPRRRQRWPTALLAFTVPVITVMFVILPHIAKPSSYTVGCRGALCSGADAQAMACGLDAITAARLRDGPTYLELRVSDRCEAAWARVSRSSPADRVSIVDDDGHSQTATVTDPAMAAQYVPTRMIASGPHSRFRACLNDIGGGRCTPWQSDD